MTSAAVSSSMSSPGVSPSIREEAPALDRSSDRWRDLHAGKRILVIDDNERTARLTAAALAPLYDSVEVESNPQCVIDLIAEARASKRPFDAIVIDLYMPGRPGIEILKELSLMESPPAAVVNTASMMSPELANLTAQWDGYRSGSALATLDRMLGPDKAALPELGVLVHFKLEGVGSLVDKLDAAMLMQTHAPRRAAEFWSAFNPLLTPVNFSAESVHHFCEHIRNFLTEFLPHWDQVKAAAPAQEWWTTAEATLEREIARLREVSFGTTLAETPAETRNRLHGAINAFTRFMPGWMPEVGAIKHVLGPDSERTFEQWGSLFKHYNELLNSVYSGFQTFHAPEFDFRAFCRGLPDDFRAGSISTPYRETDFPPIPDPDRSLRAFLTDLSGLLNAHRLEGSAGCAFIPEAFRKHEHEPLTSRLNSGNFGSYYTVYFNLERGVNSDKFFAPLLPSLPALERSGRLRWEISEGDPKHVSFYIRATEKSLDFAAIAAEKAVKQPDGTRVMTTDRGDEHKVQEDLGAARNIVVVSRPPLEARDQARPILYRSGIRIIYADGNSHMNAACLAAEYLEFSAREGENPGATPDPDRIYIDCLRLAVSHGRIKMDSEPGAGSQEWAFKALEELGVARAKIKIEPSFFASKPIY